MVHGTKSAGARIGAALVGAAVALGVTQPVAAQGGSGGGGGGGDGDTVASEILVKMRSETPLNALLLKYGLTMVDRFGSRPIFRLKTIGPANVGNVVNALSAEPDVLVAEPNYVQSTPEARRNQPWAIGNPQAFAAQWAPQAMRLPEALARATGAGVRVAVLDTGVDATHPMLQGHLLPGFDFVDFDANPAEVGNVGNPGFGHGTHVAGLVAMVAPEAMIVPYRVLDASGQGNVWVLAEALLRAVDPDGNPDTDDGAHIVNLSLGTLSRTRLFNAVAQLVTCTPPDAGLPETELDDRGYDVDRTRCSHFGGVVVVAASGNDGSSAVREYPAAEGFKGLIAVAASGSDGKLAKFSNSGSWIQMAAPGDLLTSAIPGGGLATWSGTSMASPLVAGTAALVRQANPGMPADDVARRVVRSTSALCGTNLRQLDAAAALNAPASPSRSCR
jgi:subtilisin family serine protease